MTIHTEPLKRIKHSLSVIIIIVYTSLLSGCLSTAPAVITTTQPSEINTEINYSDYYLWLKTLTKKQILVEEKKQSELIRALENDKQKDHSDSLSKLILIYSLPNTSIHHPYRAKRLLNEHLLTSNNNKKENLAFTMLLRDQLNTQLKLMAKREETSKSVNKKLDENNALIAELQKQLEQVNKQLVLLKKIDKKINERG